MKLFDLGFLTLTLLDIIDISLVAILLYQIYKLVKGSLAVNILLGLISIYLLWLVVDAIELRLLSKILGQFIGVGVISLIILFQPEIRRFLLMIGKNTTFSNYGWLRRFFFKGVDKDAEDVVYIRETLEAAETLAATMTGALIVFARTSELQFFANSGTPLDARVSSRLLESIFQKSSPLHDGAVIIANKRIKAASCVLPVTENQDLPEELGLRHRSGIGISEHSDAIVLIVSEETGSISIAINGQLEQNLTRDKIYRKLLRNLQENPQQA